MIHFIIHVSLYSCSLGSSGTGFLSVSWIKTKQGDASISFYAPHLWNKPPEYLRGKQSDNLNQNWTQRVYM